MTDQVMVCVYTWRGVSPGATHWHVHFYAGPKVDKHHDRFTNIADAVAYVDRILDEHFNGWAVSYDVDQEYYDYTEKMDDPQR